MRLVARLLLGVSSVVLLACTTTTSRLRTRFSKEHDCPEADSRVVESGGTVYVASGCGQRVEYVCQTFASMNDDPRTCVERGLDTKKPGGDPPPLPGGKAPPDPPGPKPK